MSNYLWHQPQNECSVDVAEVIEVPESPSDDYVNSECDLSEINSPTQVTNQCEQLLSSVPLEKYFDWSDCYGGFHAQNQFWPNYDQESQEKIHQGDSSRLEKSLEHSCDIPIPVPELAGPFIEFPVKTQRDFDLMDEILRDNKAERYNLIKILKKGQRRGEDKLKLLRKLISEEAVTHVGLKKLSKKSKRTKLLSNSLFFTTLFEVWTDDKDQQVVDKYFQRSKNNISYKRRKAAAAKETVTCRPPPNWEKTLRDLFAIITIINSQFHNQ